MLRACIALIALCALFAHADALPIFVSNCTYSYSASSAVGPDNWVCPDGTTGVDTWQCVGASAPKQSPIDLPENVGAVEIGPNPNEFDSLVVQPERLSFGDVASRVDFPQTGGVSFDDRNVGDGITLKANTFVGLYIRIPSEHTIGGKQRSLEVQLVYEDSNSSTPAYTIVAFLADVGNGDSAGIKNLNDSIWLALNNSEFNTDLAGFNDGQSFWSYQGTFTSPPCQDALCTVLRVTDQTLAFFDSFQAGTVSVATPPRPVQPRNSRHLTLVDPATSKAKGGNWKVAVGVSAAVLGVIFIILIIGAVVFRS